MPTFRLWSIAKDETDRLWVYAVDEWDARDQVKRALGIDASNSALFCCEQDNKVQIALDIIKHSTGEVTNVPEPTQCIWLEDSD